MGALGFLVLGSLAFAAIELLFGYCMSRLEAGP